MLFSKIRGGVRLYFEITNYRKKITEIQELKNAEKNNSIFIKRDDLIAFSFGGNKARKAMNFFEEIDAGDYDCVVTYGSSSSNHCRIVSNMAAARKLPCYIIAPQETSELTFNSMMMKLFSAKITVVPLEKVHDTIEKQLETLHEEGKKPYFIAGGGHGNLGTQAYVDCYNEIREYEAKNQMQFDYIFFASGTGTTQAGLVCGQLMDTTKTDRKIVGISIARKNPRGRQVVLDSVFEYMAEKEIEVKKSEAEQVVLFNDDYVGLGYGKNNEEIKKTIQEIMLRYGIPLDSTYTAKAYNGMKKYIEQNGIKGKKILFIHTGGTPLFFDDLEKNL